jgi:hypothetical protein
MNIEEFIKHCESKGYEIDLDKGASFKIDKQTQKGLRTLLYVNNGKVLQIIFDINQDYESVVYNGKIESLEQFDLIDRLTS